MREVFRGRRNLSDTEVVRHGSSSTESGVVRLSFVGQHPCRTTSCISFSGPTQNFTKRKKCVDLSIEVCEGSLKFIATERDKKLLADLN